MNKNDYYLKWRMLEALVKTQLRDHNSTIRLTRLIALMEEIEHDSPDM